MEEVYQRRGQLKVEKKKKVRIERYGNNCKSKQVLSILLLLLIGSLFFLRVTLEIISSSSGKQLRYSRVFWHNQL